MYKVSNKDILYTKRIEPIFYNYKWSITSKNYESLYCTSVTYIILYINYTSIIKKTKKLKAKAE